LIKEQFDVMTNKFEISDKIFKIVADQAANVKCAFKNTTSSHSNAPVSTPADFSDVDQLGFVDKLTFNMLFKQRKAELVSQKEKILEKQLMKVTSL